MPHLTALRVMAVALWLVAVGVVVVGVTTPYALPAAAVTDTPAARPATVAAVAFDELLDVNLRRPLVDAPAATAPAVAAVPVGPDVRLAGIMAEPGHSFAVFTMPGGATEVRTVGQTVGGGEVVAISPTAVTLRVAGRMTTMHLPLPHLQTKQ